MNEMSCSLNKSVDGGEDPIRHVVAPEVQDQLVAALGAGPVREMVGPVRVGAVQVAVGVYHLGLHPEPKPHAELGHPLDQRSQPARELLEVGCPVPEPCMFISAADEPPVVHHEQLHSHLGR